MSTDALQLKKERTNRFRDSLCMVFFCIAYIVAVNVTLNPNYMNGEKVVSSFEKSFSLFRAMICIPLLLILKEITFRLVDDATKVAYYLIRALFFLYEIPVVLSYCLFNHDLFTSFFVFETIYWIFICVAYRFLTMTIVRFKFLDGVHISKKFVRIAIIGVVFLGLVYSIRSIGGISVSFSLAGVYRVRAAFKESTSDLITFFKSAMGGYIVPCLIAYFFARKKFIGTAMSVALQCGFYLLARDKVYLFVIPIALIVGFWGQLKKMTFTDCLDVGYVGYGCGLFLAAAGYMRTVVMELLTRRMMVVPSYLNYIYFDFFAVNTPIWWRQDTFFIDKFFNPVYNQSVPLEISEVYFKKLEGNPNAGMFAEAASRCGYFGIFIYPIMLALLFYVIDRLFKNATKEVKVTLGICFAISVSNDVITSTSFVITFVLICLASRFFSGPDQNSEERKRIRFEFQQ